MEHQRGGKKQTRVRRGAFAAMARYIDVFVNAKTVRFALISAGTFFGFGTLMYSV
jgi:hypothetical protein